MSESTTLVNYGPRKVGITIPGSDDYSPANLDDSTRRLSRSIEFVGSEDDRDTDRRRLGHSGIDRGPTVGIESSVRLVKQPEGRSTSNERGERDPASLPL